MLLLLSHDQQLPNRICAKLVSRDDSRVLTEQGFLVQRCSTLSNILHVPGMASGMWWTSTSAWLGC